MALFRATGKLAALKQCRPLILHKTKAALTNVLQMVLEPPQLAQASIVL